MVQPLTFSSEFSPTTGIALDHSTAFPDHPCGPDEREKNYTICFATFSVLMGAALICATQINFKYDFSSEAPEIEKPPPEPTREDYLQQELAQQLNLPALATNSINAPPPPVTSKVRKDQTLWANWELYFIAKKEELCRGLYKTAKFAKQLKMHKKMIT